MRAALLCVQARERIGRDGRSGRRRLGRALLWISPLRELPGPPPLPLAVFVEPSFGRTPNGRRGRRARDQRTDLWTPFKTREVRSGSHAKARRGRRAIP